MVFKKIFILGASRGLGRATSLFLTHHLESVEKVWISSRKEPLLKKLQGELKEKGLNTEVLVHDYSQAIDIEEVHQHIQRESPDLVIYSAGGGPYGNYQDKDWKDHSWALQMGLVAPMRLAHSWLQARAKEENPGRFIIVGSRIAESSPDFGATSYAAAKHALLGFVESLQPELKNSPQKVWLFSPGYINTDMLPHNARVRHDGSKIMSVETAAQALLRWLKKDGPWHRVLN